MQQKGIIWRIILLVFKYINKNKWPFLIELAVSLLLLLLLPDYFPKYKIELKDKFPKGINQSYYHDLDNDGYSERIMLQFEQNNSKFPTLKTYRYNQNFINELVLWHIPIKRKWAQNSRAFFFDWDKNGIDEIYFFSIEGDSLFLEKNLYPSKEIVSKYIGIVSIIDGLEDFQVFGGKHADLNNDGFEEIIFIVTDGWKPKNRDLYAFDVKNDSLFKSPKMYANMQGTPELFSDSTSGNTYFAVSTYASANCENFQTDTFLSDTNSYLLVFDKNLDLVFNPHIYPGKTSGVVSQFICDNDEIKILSRIAYLQDNVLNLKAQITDINGQILAEKDFRNRTNGLNIESDNEREESRILMFTPGHASAYDSKLNMLKTEVLPFEARFMTKADYNLDGSDDFLYWSRKEEKLYITRSDFSNPVEIDFPGNDNYIYYTIKLNGKDNPYISFDTSKFILNYHYYKNPFYNLKYLVLFAVFIFIFFLSYLTIRIRNEIYLRREKELVRLQYNSIKNQADPHFTLNVLNSISGLYSTKRHDEAERTMIRFSRLMQQSLVNSDRITVSLEEELDFCRNFIEIQQTRFNNCFEYEINDIAGSKVEVPRMLIHQFVENSIKHGLLPKEKPGGKLDICIENLEKTIEVQISDNGIGRKESQKQKTHGTGKGIGIADNILDLYRKISGRKINYKYVDIENTETDKTGTIVKIQIPK